MYKVAAVKLVFASKQLQMCTFYIVYFTMHWNSVNSKKVLQSASNGALGRHYTVNFKELNQLQKHYSLTVFVDRITLLGPVVQSLISVNLKFYLTCCLCFSACMIIRFRTLGNKTSIEPEKISGKTYST